MGTISLDDQRQFPQRNEERYCYEEECTQRTEQELFELSILKQKF